jgi:predicted MPP superfamily phosphohydrolase
VRGASLSLLDFLIVGCALAGVAILRISLRRLPAFRRAQAGTWIDRAAVGFAVLILLAMAAAPVLGLTPAFEGEWIQAIGFSSGILISIYAILSLTWHLPPVDERRRHLLKTAGRVAFAAPAAAFGYGVFVERLNLQGREVTLKIPDLPAGLDGLRIAQLTDIHLSAFFSVGDLERAIGLANEFRPQLAVVTGDLITRAGDPLDDGIDALRRLRADAGTFGCLGNHEIYAGAEDYAHRRALAHGIYFLRQQAAGLPFGDARLNLIGVDYQRNSERMLTGVETLVSRQPRTLNLLLSHNPNAFLRAQQLGIPVTLAGHTHGGQVTVELLEQTANVARFVTKYVRGLYREQGSLLYVCPGLGTVGVPIRLQVLPEVALITLRSA